MKKSYLFLLFVLLFLYSLYAVKADNLITNLSVYYTMNGSDSTKEVNVFSGLGNLTQTGTSKPVQTQIGKINGSLGTYNTTKYLTTVLPRGLSSATSQTFAFWFYLNDSKSTGRTFMDITNLQRFEFDYFNTTTSGIADGNTGYINWQMGKYGVCNNPTSWKTNVTFRTWHHIVLTYNGSSKVVNVYMNGLLNSSYTESICSTGGASTTMVLGYWNQGAQNPAISIFLDEFAIWNRVLNSTEASQLYNNGSGLTYPFIAAPTLPTPTFVSPTPANNSLLTNNLNLSFNVSTGVIGADNCTLYFNGGSYLMTNQSTISYNYTLFNLASGTYNYYANCSLTNVQYSTGSYNVTVPQIFSIKGITKYNNVALPNTTVLLVNTTSNIVIGNYTSNSTGGYIFSDILFPQIKLGTIWGITAYFNNTYSKNVFVNISVADN